MIKIAPSILSADFTRLGEQVGAAATAGADYIHIDVMDGHFVPNITIGPLIVEAVKRATDRTLDVHLMIEQPERYVPEFIAAGADIITVHYEACVHLHRVVQAVRESGRKIGVSINPATPVSVFGEILPDIDLALIMTVNPGFGGQSFIRSGLSKIARLQEMISAAGLAVELEVDGGVNAANAAEVVAAGGRVLVAGSAVFNKRESIAEAIARLQAAAALGLPDYTGIGNRK